MPYRKSSDALSGTGELVTFRSYLDPVQAKLDAARLMAEGIETHIFGEGSHNVVVVGTAAGVRLHVREGDIPRATALLDDHPVAEPRDDGEAEGVVRCPRCELAYCFYERMRMEGSSGAVAVAVFAAPFLLFLKKRWHCHKCGHVWDDPKEGPRAMTRLEDGDPTPVFRLRRAHTGMGLFLGVMAGFLGALLASMAKSSSGPSVGAVFLLGAPILGWVIGRSLRYDLCSEPSCRTRLPHDREDCPRCKGVIGGLILSAEDHYSSAADVRRELAAMRDDAPKALPPKKKKKKSRPLDDAH